MTNRVDLPWQRWPLLAVAVLWLCFPGCAAAPQHTAERPPRLATPTPPPPEPPRLSLQDAEKAAEQRLRQLELRRRVEDQQLNALASIAQRYEELLDRPGTPEERRAELLLRVAELAYREEEAALRETYESGAEPAAAPGQRYPRSRAYYTRLTERYPDSPQALTAYYNLGYLLAEEGEDALSADAYGHVLERDPRTPYADEIHMRLGEALFDRGEAAAAAEHYRAVIAGGRLEYLDKAHYKLGWCYFNLEDYAAATAAFDRVLSRGGASVDDLREETVGVLARCFFEGGGLAALRDYLTAHPEGFPYGPRLYLLVGQLAMEASRYSEAEQVFAAGVDAYPAAAECVEMEDGLILALLTSRVQGRAMVRREMWLERYGPGSAWDARHGRGPLAPRRDAMLEEGLRLAALYHHGASQRGQGGLGKALTLYREYRERFGVASEEGYELNFAYAQALMEAGQAAGAAARYQEVARDLLHTAHREDAAYRRIAALEELYREDPAVLDDLAAAHAEYVALSPDSPLVTEVLFAEGELYFAAERFPAARGVFSRLAREHPDHDLARQALERIARCRFREGAYQDSETACRRALRSPLDEASSDRLHQLLAFSIFKQAEALEDAGAPAGANRHFLRLAEELPRDETAPIALYRAAENLRSMGEAGAAARVYDRLAREYPGSEYRYSALVLSARIFSTLGEWEEAARGYEAIYRADPDTEEAPEALFAAAQAWLEGARDTEAAHRFAELAATFPLHPRAAEALYREGRILQERGRTVEAIGRYRAAWGAGAAGDAGVYRALAMLALGKLRLAEFESVDLRGDLEESLLHKEELLGEALEHLTRAASLPFAETLTESSYLGGAAFEHMKSALLSSERPPGLSPEEREEYDFLLEEKAFPLEERAVGYYRRGIAAAREAGLHTRWVDRMYGRLEELLPWAYQRQEVPALVWAMPALVAPGAGAGGPPGSAPAGAAGLSHGAAAGALR